METEEVKGNPMLCEFTLKTQDMDMLDRSFLINDIYQIILCEDKLWHFFYEEEQGDIIRCSPEFSEDVKHHLVNNNIDFSFKDTWLETIPQIMEFSDYFSKLFHLNSEYIINLRREGDELSMTDFELILDRTSHQLYNNYTMMYPNFKAREVFILANLLTDRAFYDGVRYQYLRAKKYSEGLNKDGSKN